MASIYDEIHGHINDATSAARAAQSQVNRAKEALYDATGSLTMVKTSLYAITGSDGDGLLVQCNVRMQAVINEVAIVQERLMAQLTTISQGVEEMEVFRSGLGA